MELSRAKEILTSLKDGINPLTGEKLPLDDSCNQGDVVRAITTILAELQTKAVKNMPENHGKPWTIEEEKNLCELYDCGFSIQKLSSYFERTEGGITSRLSRLGKIQNRDGIYRKK